MKHCSCGGAILEPNKGYLYSGPICTCKTPDPIQMQQNYIGQLGGQLQQTPWYIDVILNRINDLEKKLNELSTNYNNRPK